ncbi:2-C-methyl-D-erythritol 4-phosphate cytidylyltransferase [Vibrio sp.]|uniref:2-C-methyl-D-erythritol 4-phosphate cytidylyltransferase n=1 Tax=Vibrio sp. TaxID=678 RepID=UPI003D140A5D
MQQASIVAVVPAAGVGSRMRADRPKQYLTIAGQTVLEHTLQRLLSHPVIDRVVVAVSKDDPYYTNLAMASDARVSWVAGGKERADSVLAALQYVQQHQLAEWVMVHDAARPCVRLADIDRLIAAALTHPVGGILATPVRDTMKRANSNGDIEHTVERAALWHALTPQMFPTALLSAALADALQQGAVITDEASALEWRGMTPALVQGQADNIKITQPEDLALAAFYLSNTDSGVEKEQV